MESRPDSIRSFVAIELDDETRAAVVRLQVHYRQQLGSAVRWVRPEGIHLTLVFLGSVAGARLQALDPALQAVGTQTPAFVLRLGSLGAFPSVTRPRVLWVRVTDAGATLAVLQRGLHVACQTQGFAVEKRAFAPHLTLGRVVAPLAGPLLLPLQPEGTAPSLEVRSFALMRSELLPSGARYTRLGDYPLMG